MDQQYIKKILIEEVRHLRDVEIDICDTEMKHLILTGKNGSGKSSVLTLIKYSRNAYLNSLVWGGDSTFQVSITDENKSNWSGSLLTNFSSVPLFWFYFDTNRILQVEKSVGVKDTVTEKAIDFEKFLAKKRTEQAFLSFESGNKKEVEKISKWFDQLELSLQYLFEDDTMRLISKRDADKVNFFLTSDHRNESDFNTLSSGYSSILSILFEMMQQMHSENGSFDYTKPGIALIDEVENHLHVSLQKKILPFLTGFFPNVQFIVSTHSPYILQSLKNTVIFDLETKQRFEDFSNYSSETILETFFDMDKFSEVQKKEMALYEDMLKSSNGKNKDEILAIRAKYYQVADIEAQFWIKDMDIRYKDKVKALLA